MLYLLQDSLHKLGWWVGEKDTFQCYIKIHANPSIFCSISVGFLLIDWKEPIDVLVILSLKDTLNIAHFPTKALHVIILVVSPILYLILFNSFWYCGDCKRSFLFLSYVIVVRKSSCGDWMFIVFNKVFPWQKYKKD